MLTRRAFAASLAATVLAAPRLARGAEALTLWGPPAAPSILLAKAAADGLLEAIAPQVTFKVWKTPDEMRAGLSSGTMEAVVVPTYVAANLHNRGLGIGLLDVLTDGLLYVVAPAGTVAGVADLKGRRVAVPFRNDMPDFVFRSMVAGAGLGPADVAVEYAGSPPEAVQFLMAGRVDAALLSEPAATAAMVQAAAAGRPLERAIDCRTGWAAGGTAVPQAGLAVTDALAGRLGGAGLGELHRGIESALAAVLADPAGAAAAAAPALGLPAPVIERAIPFSNLVARPASAARDDLVRLFDVLATADPRIIGGKQPGDRFYVL